MAREQLQGLKGRAVYPRAGMAQPKTPREVRSLPPQEPVAPGLLVGMNRGACLVIGQAGPFFTP